MLKRTVIDLSKPKGKRRKVVTLSAAEEATQRAEWAANEQAAAAESSRKAEIDEMLAIREELLYARAVGDEPSSSTIERYRALRAKHPNQ